MFASLESAESGEKRSDRVNGRGRGTSAGRGSTRQHGPRCYPGRSSLRERPGEIPVQEDHIYRKTEIVGSSGKSLSDAIETAVARAAKTLRHVEWFEVSEIRGQVRDGKVAFYQVGLKVGFRVED